MLCPNFMILGRKSSQVIMFTDRHAGVLNSCNGELYKDYVIKDYYYYYQ